MVRHKLLYRWMPLFGLALAISLAGNCHGQVKMKEAPAKAAAAKAAAVSPQSMSVAVGEAFPNFELKDQDGKSFSLSKTLKEAPVVLVIYRSADW